MDKERQTAKMTKVEEELGLRVISDYLSTRESGESGV
jgi:hypothetical protein